MTETNNLPAEPRPKFWLGKFFQTAEASRKLDLEDG